ncbi:glycoside hydrolase family 125 protein [Aplosporella prunicola CBS 121167]|uniref:Glycoside hydrolase family 125 protein n=1 Tax=Aplosporella prunicola CBS 121167 TaxID=1176127 RepID=A0A6A6BI11_9PEZI|nr:glycoside hydrolase family 125 protein [Aplosporella prunicola CBS 121167]KAF2143636.1 glycoside hydrolase family 125 protein [Aplosporella prunicola CBS 121167]
MVPPMSFLATACIAFLVLVGLVGHCVHATPDQHPLKGMPEFAKARQACPDYKTYAMHPHPPYSDGPMELPFQRPAPICRTFESPLVDKVIEAMKEKMMDKDLARIFENAFPNTLDTTVRWHVDGSEKSAAKAAKANAPWQGAQSFIVTGDINAEWLRDSTNQLAQYQKLAKKDKALESLILGAINTQAEFIIGSPYCNAFQPPPPSKLAPSNNGMDDIVHPAYEPSFVFECKYELDSLAHFLSLTNQFYSHTGSTQFLTARWYTALDILIETIGQQAKSTFDKLGDYRRNEYTFRRRTDSGTETLNLAGLGNPLNSGTGLVRSAFRPSDDATILGFLVPANAMMAVELRRCAEILKKVGDSKAKELVKTLQLRGQNIEAGIWEHGVVPHKKYGNVFAFEVDGYGSSILMDDANLPSLLALPLMGFVDVNDETYQNTRRMILEKAGNPYYLKGKNFQGIGGPHIGLQNAWPMSLLIQAMTSDDDEEIMEAITFVKQSSKLGLIHESIDVNHIRGFTRPWFAWANSVFAQTILDLAARKPHLLFGEGAKPYIIE